MIDWISILFNSFWIVGLALLLAGLSYRQWEARQTNARLRDKLETAQFNKLFWLSFILVTIGLAGTSERIWERFIWIIFILLGLLNIMRGVAQR